MQKKHILSALLVVVFLGLIASGIWFFVSQKKVKDVSYTNTNEVEALEEVSEETGETGEKEEVVSPETLQVPEEKEEVKKEEKPVEESAPEKDIASPKITNRLMGSGFAKSSGRKIDTVVLHSSYDALGSDPYSVSGLVKEYEEYGVSAHYLIDRKGSIYRLVEDKNIAYHAGSSKMKDGRTNVNDFSIGIEMMNLDDGKSEYTSAQYGAVNDLVSYLKDKYAIKFVVGHDDIAPGRKSDPWNFEWKKLK